MSSVLSDPTRFRKAVAGVSLIGAPLAGFVSCLPDSSEGTGVSGAALYATLKAHAAGIHTSGLVFMISAVLTVPMALGLAHLLRQRGSILGHLGAVALCLGAFGHFGYGFWQVLVSTTPLTGARDDVIATLDRVSHTGLILLPFFLCVDLGIVLLSAGLLRAHVVPSWAPWTAIAIMVADTVVQSSDLSSPWPVTALWGALAIVFGTVGVRVLTMSPDAWKGFYTESSAAQEPPTSIAVGSTSGGAARDQVKAR